MKSIYKVATLLALGFLGMVARSSTFQFIDYGINAVSGICAGFLFPLLLPEKLTVKSKALTHSLFFIPFFLPLFINSTELNLLIDIVPVVLGYALSLIWNKIHLVRYKVLFTVLFLGFSCWCYVSLIPSLCFPYHTREVSKKLPEYHLTALTGADVTWKNFDKKVVFIDFWFLGCGTCLQGMPYRNDLFIKYKDNPNVLITTVNIRPDSVHAVRKYFQSNQFEIGVLFDKKRTFFPLMNLQGAPCGAVLDRKGVVRRFYLGWSRDMDRIFTKHVSQDIEELLEEPL